MDYYALVEGVEVIMNPKISSKSALLSVPPELAIRTSQPAKPSTFDDSLQQFAIRELQQFKAEYEQFKQTQILVSKELDQVKMRNVAPGLTSAQLVPTASSSSPASQQTSRVDSPDQSQPSLNYLEFEQGLPPANPWDTPSNPADDLKQLMPAGGRQQHSPSNSVSSTGDRPSDEQPPGLLPRPKPSLVSSLPSNLSTPLSKITSQLKTLGNNAHDALFNQVVSWGCNPQYVKEGQRYYNNPHKVMDYCLNVEKQLKAGYTLQEVNDAVELYGSDSPTHPLVLNYLSAYIRVREVGFDRERVKQALRSTLGPQQQPPKTVDAWSQEAVASLLNY